mgnify:FL=1
MEQVISFTPSELWTWFLGACVAVATISGAGAALGAWLKKAKQPETEREERITRLEETVARHDKLFRNDKSRLDEIESGNRVMQMALLALLDHGIDGNNLEQMKQAKEDLQRHLVER